ncbi:MAG: 2-phosphosulfolactate phosphatase [Actinobacteria bacterium]|nr:2-phosphosulfolactate phosphatase [Actinomycetota bacterium]
MEKTVVIDCFYEQLGVGYAANHTIVAVDVIRSTTTAVTAVATGRRCFPVPSLEAAVPLAARLDRPLLVGELGGYMPFGFDMNNSPVRLAAFPDTSRPVILLSTSGTKLLHEARAAEKVYVACLRNFSAQVRRICEHHTTVVLMGAGTRGEFREEDELCCAWMAELLIAEGFRPLGATGDVVKRWSGRPVDALLGGKSSRYLQLTDQTDDLDFILEHCDDLNETFVFDDDEVKPAPPLR